MNLKDVFKYSLITGLVAILFLPFIISSSQLFPFISGKAFVFRILVEILFGVWLIAMFRDQDLRPRFSWISCSVLMFVGVVSLADIFGVNFYKSFWSNFERMDGLASLLHLVAYFFVASSVLNTRGKWQIFFNFSVVSSVVMSIYVFRQLAGKIVINQGGVRVDGTFGNATYLAIFMLFNFFITLFLLARVHLSGQITGQSNNQTRWGLSGWYVLVMGMQIIVLYYTATRGAILGLIGGLLLAALTVAIFEKKQLLFRNTALGVLIGVFVLIGGFFMLRNTEFATSSPTLSRFSSLSIEEVSKQGRRYVWPMAIQGFLEKPILGWGQENFNYVFNKYYDPRMYNQEPWFDRAHNIVLDWMVAGGALGLLAYLSIFIALLVSIWKSQSFSVSEKSFLLGLTAAYFFQNLFVFDNLVSYIYFFSLLAFVHSDRVTGKTEPVWFTKFSANVLFTQKVLPVVAVVFIIGAVYCLNIKPILANRNIISALSTGSVRPEEFVGHFKKVFEYKTFADGEASEQMVSNIGRFTGSNASDELKTEFVQLTKNAINLQTLKFDSDARYFLFAGSLLNRLGDFKGAIPYLEKARELSPKKQSIIFETGLSYLSAGENEKALEQFKMAYDLAPDFSEAQILYAIGALYAKKTSLAHDLLAALPETVVAGDERIVSAYAGTGNLAEAIRLIEKRVVWNPEDPVLRFRLAAGYMELNQRAKAIEILREVIRLFPAQKEKAESFIKEIQAGRNP